jgi:hypothetical protein
MYGSVIKGFVSGGFIDKKPLSTDPKNPDKVRFPPDPIPAIEDLEEWSDDTGTIVHAWEFGNTVYLTVMFDHVGVCFAGEVAPSNTTRYVYVYDYSDVEDEVFDETGQEVTGEEFA